MQDNTLLTVCSERLLVKLGFFQYSRRIQKFSKQMKTILYSRRAPKTSNKTKWFYYSRWIQKYSKQMQEDVLLTACTEKLLKN